MNDNYNLAIGFAAGALVICVIVLVASFIHDSGIRSVKDSCTQGATFLHKDRLYTCVEVKK